MTGFVVCLLRGDFKLHAANYRCHVGKQVFSCVAGDADEAKRKAEAWCPGEIEVCSCCAQATGACRKCKGTGDMGGNHEREWIKCDECGGSGDAP